ncbi:MFS transporter [Paenibacillus sp. N3.4]|uniref:MFS transporter n=1 Tax=Paenibacillus sp. N3.4 TaxID=2603222 RepID=UPI0016503C38|nr:MFS transporter [Paenibacillus sp. N3.4]
MKLSFRIALLCLAVTATFAPMIAAPAVKLLMVDFPDTSALLIQWVVTLSSLFILPTLFIAGYLSKKFSRKHILLVGLILYIIGGIGPSFMNSISWILVFRAILGLSIGLISPTFNAMIAENFQGRERYRMNGFVASVNGIGGALFLTIGGVIASYGWRSVFLSYSYAIILLILVALFIPKIPPAQTNEQNGIQPRAKIPLMFYTIALLSGLHVMLYFIIPTSLSLYLGENGIGTASTVGYLSALSLIGVFGAGLSITAITRLFQKALVPFALLVIGLGFLLLSLAQSMWMLTIAVILIGFAEGMFFPISFNKTAELVPKQRMTTAISLLLGCNYVVQFICPLFMKGIQALFHFSSYRETFMLLAMAIGVSMIASLLLMRKVNEQSVLNN